MSTETALRLQERDPRDLVPAPWNPNKATPDDQLKLDESLRRMGMFKPIVCRELEDGRLQILGGHWRCDSAIRLGMNSVPVINLGTVAEERAKEITLVDNGRYGHDDAALLAELIQELGTPQDLAAFMPYAIVDLEAIVRSTAIDLDDLGLEEADAPAPERQKKAQRTHEILRFKVTLEDAERLRGLVKATMTAQGFKDADDLTNAGDALVHLLLGESTET